MPEDWADDEGAGKGAGGGEDGGRGRGREYRSAGSGEPKKGIIRVNRSKHEEQHCEGAIPPGMVRQLDVCAWLRDMGGGPSTILIQRNLKKVFLSPASHLFTVSPSQSQDVTLRQSRKERRLYLLMCRSNRRRREFAPKKKAVLWGEFFAGIHWSSK